MYVVPCVLLKKIYNNYKIMVKKLNKKHCSQASWEQCFLFNFFFTIILLFFFNNTQGTTYIKNIIIIK